MKGCRVETPPELDVISFSAAIKDDEKGEMRKAGMSPNVNSFNAASSACEKRGQRDQALSLQEGMRKTNGTQNAE
eukprot:7949462-Karenia_brevis.AAC.1